MLADLVLGFALAACSVIAPVVLRPRCAKGWFAALSFVVPGAALVACGVWLALSSYAGIAVVAFAAAALCFGASAVFVPTRAARFRDFERQFWHYLSEHTTARVHSRD